MKKYSLKSVDSLRKFCKVNCEGKKKKCEILVVTSSQVANTYVQSCGIWMLLLSLLCLYGYCCYCCCWYRCNGLILHLRSLRFIRFDWLALLWLGFGMVWLSLTSYKCLIVCCVLLFALRGVSIKAIFIYASLLQLFIAQVNFVVVIFSCFSLFTELNAPFFSYMALSGYAFCHLFSFL